MIKIERTEVFNLEGAIRGARNPMNSWDRMDSTSDGQFILGANDLSLAQRLAKAGSDHRKYLRQIFVSVDITAPLYWWKEYDTYKVGTVANSCSTMHKIHAKEFDLDDFSNEHMLPTTLFRLRTIVECLNANRKDFLETGNKEYWWQMIQLLPSSYNQLRTCTLSYETLLNQYRSRKNHKLDEWHTYCDWILTLPYFPEMCLGGETDSE